MYAAKPFLTKNRIVNICRDHFGLLVDSDDIIRELTSYDDRNYQVKGKKNVTTSGKERGLRGKNVALVIVVFFYLHNKKNCSEKNQGNCRSGLLRKHSKAGFV